MKKTLLQRVRDVVLADLYSALETQEKKNPIALLNQYLRDGVKEVETIEKLVDRHRMLQKNFMHELEQARYMAAKRAKQASIANQAGEVTLAERAEQESVYYQDQVVRLEKMHATTAEQVEDLQLRLEEMKNKLKEMHAKRMELMARENVANAQRRINDTLYKISGQSSFLRFEEIEEQIRQIEKQVVSEAEQDGFDYKIAQLEKRLQQSV
ncbi:PspA/IM30 family protein [Ectobacillus antri]|jgi:phage shock protein A|uniref:PspA/IM30 family protein n=1 Tax=Ectobacillus antri TaxID=2486280 RepID=A0ABT6H1S3_9BACI|nr:PspA/IM30 family protein [Ectobacillus antri]MDG4656033.1 PspA/IM30 family protein [Ectobacillus antri]MDG5752708.1 PspA/IM30 family protein [Ectobacillus antri]